MARGQEIKTDSPGGGEARRTPVMAWMEASEGCHAVGAAALLKREILQMIR